MANRNLMTSFYRSLATMALVTALTSSTAMAGSCRLAESIIGWTSPDRVISILRVYVASNGMTDQVTTMGMVDVYRGNAIHVPQGTNVEVLSVNHIVSEIRVNGISLFTPTMAIKCR